MFRSKLTKYPNLGANSPGIPRGGHLAACPVYWLEEKFWDSAMPDEVAKWLRDLGLGQYVETFAENAVEPEILPDLTELDLKELGVHALGHRKRLLRAIRALSRHPADDSGATTPDAEMDADEDISIWTRTPGERKPVTVLFVDVVDSTAITESLDPEDTHDLLYHAVERMCEIVERNRGAVCRFMGDGIMAMFGAPVASERHAFEACRAALQIRDALERYADELEGRYDHRIRIRAGMHSGEVVVLEVGDDPKRPEYDASGPTVPLAARMEQIANPDTIMMTASTRAMAGRLIEAEELQPAAVKGVTEPVAVFRLTGIARTDSPVAFGIQAPFVGRRAELAQFRGLLDECLASGRGQSLYLRGEPGIGKTRLVEEMIRIAAARGFGAHKILVLDFGVGKGQAAIPALARSLLRIKPGGNKRKRERKLDRAEAGQWVDPDHRVFFNDLLNLNQPLELRTLYDAMEVATRIEGRHRAVTELLTRVAGRKSVLLVIEGLHWADPEVMDFLVGLTATVAENPVLMILTSRMEGDPIDTNWRARTSEHPLVTWDLGPLRTEECLQMVNSIGNVGSGFAQMCVARAEGNPLFLEQLLLGGEKSKQADLPDSIKSLVLSRIDHLDSEDKMALRAASVLGQRFDHESLCYLLETVYYDCQRLIDHHLLRPEGTQFLFAHALIQHGAYSSLLKNQRAELHRRAARWFDDHDLVLHAEHLDHAGDEAAADAYLRAARDESGRYRPERALRLTRRGLEIAPPAERFALCCHEGEMLRILGKVPESIESYRLAATAAGGEVGRCQAWIGMAEGLSDSGAHGEVIDLLRQAEAIARDHKLVYELARIYQIRGSVLFFRGEIDACLEAGKRSLAYAREAGSTEVEALALSGLGNAEYNRGRFISAGRYFDQCLALAREQGFGRIIAANLSLRGYVTYWQNDLDAARRDCVEAIEQARRTGDQRAEMLALIIGGSFWAGIGDLAEGERWLGKAQDITRRMGARIFEGVCAYLLGRFAFQRGDLEQARQLAQDGVEILTRSESGITFGGPIAMGVLALAAENAGRSRELLSEAESLLDAGSVGHNYLNFYEDAMETCLRTGTWDEVERFADALERYTREEPLPRCDFLVARGKVLARFGRGDRDNGVGDELERLCAEANRIGLVAALPALEQARAARLKLGDR